MEEYNKITELPISRPYSVMLSPSPPKIYLVQEIFSIISDKRKHSYLKPNWDLDLVLREGIQERTNTIQSIIINNSSLQLDFSEIISKTCHFHRQIFINFAVILRLMRILLLVVCSTKLSAFLLQFTRLKRRTRARKKLILTENTADIKKVCT